MSRPWDELLKVKFLTLWSANQGWVPFGLFETPRARGDEDLAEQFEKIDAKCKGAYEGAVTPMHAQFVCHHHRATNQHISYP
eukprot:scaffold9289_cov119-Skeletonema_dohrnii-CCMP3373.AAC.5